jgi:F-type H+-transporting ATPase subunit a
MSDLMTEHNPMNEESIPLADLHQGDDAHMATAGHESTGAPDSYLMPHEIPNVAMLIEAYTTKMQAHGTVRPHPSETINGVIPITPLFSIFYAIVIVMIVRWALRKPSIERPGKLQNAVEALLGGLRRFYGDIMGPGADRFIPFLGSLWLFIWINNVAVLIPGLKSPSSSVKTTFALGICTFFYVQFNAIKYSGFKGWLHHMLGSPTDTVTWCLSPLFFFLEIVGELVKPVSLSLRLFGNIFGEDKLLASFLGMGMMIVAAIAGTPHPIIGIPLHLPFFFLVVLLSTIQATVFSLLAAIYIVLLLPHGGHEHEGEHETHAIGAQLATADNKSVAS